MTTTTKGPGEMRRSPGYPSTQQLQELRDQLAEANGINVFGPEAGGAWQMERRHGIGYRLGDLGNRIFSAWEPGPAARREASAMRIRAAAR